MSGDLGQIVQVEQGKESARVKMVNLVIRIALEKTVKMKSVTTVSYN